MYIPKYFKAKELIDRHSYGHYRDVRGKSDNWMLGIMFDERLLRVIDNIRAEFGSKAHPMVINDWSWGGAYQFSGWRSPGCSTGATLSQHKFGRAVDMKPSGNVTAKEIRADIINWQYLPEWKDIGGFEMDKNWLHIDVRARDMNGKINLFYA
jgi:hypothetical protein